MTIDTNSILSLSECAENFGRALRIADKIGQAVIFQDDRPKYLLLDIDSSPIVEMTDDEKIDFVAARILKKYHRAFEELAK